MTILSMNVAKIKIKLHQRKSTNTLINHTSQYFCLHSIIINMYGFYASIPFSLDPPPFSTSVALGGPGPPDWEPFQYILETILIFFYDYLIELTKLYLL